MFTIDWSNIGLFAGSKNRWLPRVGLKGRLQPHSQILSGKSSIFLTSEYPSQKRVMLLAARNLPDLSHWSGKGR